MTENKIKVLLIDDSPIVLNILKRILDKSSEVLVIGTASNGSEGLDQVRFLNPDVICTDLMMPVMDGLEFTKRLMETTPKPILVISAALQGENETNVFQLLEAGALDIFPKPAGGTDKDYDLIRDKLVSKIRVIRSIPVYKKTRKLTEADTASFHSLSTTSKQTIKFLAIGASTGGPNAIQQILGHLPKEIPVPVLCVQHISDGFIDSMVSWLGQNTKLRVKIMQEGETPVAGTVYFPQNLKHMVIGSDGKLQVSNEPPFNGHCPSVNVLFKSLARYSGDKTLAVILTGMGDDGATGLLTIKHTGGKTIGESESTCVVYGMPKVAKEIGALDIQLPIDKIASHILGLL
jgi:two-component system, chemotaxis family, protein-glutamate methylesterase/glutaminase